MKFSQRWLAELLGAEVELEQMLERLTLAGLEVDGHQSLQAIDNLVIGHVEQIVQHPDADRLRVCTVNDGNDRLQIVCGAPNARADMTVAVARIGSKLPGGLKIKRSKLRGVESNGMLCSAAELGLGQDHDGILDLPADLPPGTPLHEVITLPDTVIDVDLTPNRGDCFSLLGVAREVATFSVLDFAEPSPSEVPATEPFDAALISDAAASPVMSTRIVRGIDPAARTPLWMVERLRRSGVRAIHPVVDITNYVMLEYGQPMHGYDLDKLSGELCVRHADGKESLTLLDGKTLTPEAETLVIADDSGAIGLAGIMGGASTMVDAETTNVLFEAAHFTPAAMAGQARRYNLHTDASLRFERGVDPYGHERAQARAAELLTEIAGGHAETMRLFRDATHLPSREPVTLRRSRLAKVLGVSVADDAVVAIFRRLGFAVSDCADGWDVTAPSWRFDIAIEEDLIEEVARVYGYDRIPQTQALASVQLASSPEGHLPLERLRDSMVAQGYAEAVTYSFVDPQIQQSLQIAAPGPTLVNPISNELSVMRGTLLAGLLQATRYNLARQRRRIRLFETGRVFGDNEEREVFAALIAGEYAAEQWNNDARAVDFFDIKSTLEGLLALAEPTAEIIFEPTSMVALHPGQAARVLRDGRDIGYIGAVHPRLAAELDIDVPCFVFEVDILSAFASNTTVSEPISRFPSVRRDIAVLVDESVPAAALAATARAAAGSLLSDLIVFDVYQGKGIEPGLKSVALGLILLDSSRTLTDEDSDGVVASIVAQLHRNHGAKLRE